jgi:aminoglycoside phosphotransferase family enzyme
MDLESFNEKALAQRFLAEYLSYFNCIKNKEDEAIFIYFKSLRANIRAKVRTISALQAGDTRSRKKYLSEINKYLLKMYEYTKM